MLFHGAEVKTIPSGGRHRLGAVRSIVRFETAALAVISPNNPTGRVLNRSILLRADFPDVLCAFDGAYAEFQTDPLLSSIIKCGSNEPCQKHGASRPPSWLCGGRGRALTDASNLGPYTIAHPSLKRAEACLAEGLERKSAFVSEVRRERSLLSTALKSVVPS